MKEIRTSEEIKKLFETHQKEMNSLKEETKVRLENEVALLKNQLEQVSLINKKNFDSTKINKLIQVITNELAASLDSFILTNINLTQECCDYYPKILEHLTFAQTSDLWDGKDNVRAERIVESEAAVLKYGYTFDSLVSSGKEGFKKRVDQINKFLELTKEFHESI